MNTLPFALVLFLSTALAAPTTVPCTGNLQFSYNDPPMIEMNGFKVPVSLYITFPAKFPNPAQQKYISAPYTIKCKTFTATADKTTFKITGNIYTTLQQLVAPFKEDEGEYDAVPGKMVLVYDGDFVYPALREDWYQDRVFFTLHKNQLQFEMEGSGELIKDDVIGYRINKGLLKPIWFEGELTKTVTFKSTDLVEVFVKGEHRGLDYLSLDFKTNTVQIKLGVPFPNK
ncbi:hypothetical protein [Deinococcus roseus]|uniref:DUF3108 domain-containing protein n=1 Tax=Deinococcus roseus TaxID=392414 RepID=A0ABQ2DKL1_9DEIO|nr:hypothetical protein [Deinococcus roseus]GGJ59409.1 hypothetical protein GCM10008938_51950 [Deinococcus roseus]